MRFKNATTENLSEGVQKVILEAVTENKGLFIFGDTGTGKTYVMHALANNRNARVENFVDLLIEYRDYMQRGTYHESIRALCSQDYVFIDDIGAEKMSDFVAEFLYLLIDARYRNMKKTIISTNLTPEDFEERYGERLLSRIYEMCVSLELQGEDKRIS